MSNAIASILAAGCPCVPAFGADTTKPSAQENHDSVCQLFAGRGIDSIKVDDLSAPCHTGKVEAIRKAIDGDRGIVRQRFVMPIADKFPLSTEWRGCLHGNRDGPGGAFGTSAARPP